MQYFCFAHLFSDGAADNFISFDITRKVNMFHVQSEATKSLDLNPSYILELRRFSISLASRDFVARSINAKRERENIGGRHKMQETTYAQENP